MHPVTVSKWRRRFAEARPEGLVDAPRPGAKRTISDDTIEAVVVDTLDATHWSTRDLAKKHGISKTTVAEIWRAFGLKPCVSDSFKISPYPQLIEKTRDVVGLYLNPARRGGGVRTGRETPDPSVGPYRSDVADAAHHTTAGHPRLPT